MYGPEMMKNEKELITKEKHLFYMSDNFTDSRIFQDLTHDESSDTYSFG